MIRLLYLMIVAWLAPKVICECTSRILGSNTGLINPHEPFVRVASGNLSKKIGELETGDLEECCGACAVRPQCNAVTIDLGSRNCTLYQTYETNGTVVQGGPITDTLIYLKLKLTTPFMRNSSLMHTEDLNSRFNKALPKGTAYHMEAGQCANPTSDVFGGRHPTTPAYPRPSSEASDLQLTTKEMGDSGPVTPLSVTYSNYPPTVTSNGQSTEGSVTWKSSDLTSVASPTANEATIQSSGVPADESKMTSSSTVGGDKSESEWHTKTALDATTATSIAPTHDSREEGYSSVPSEPAPTLEVTTTHNAGTAVSNDTIEGGEGETTVNYKFEETTETVTYGRSETPLLSDETATESVYGWTGRESTATEDGLTKVTSDATASITTRTGTVSGQNGETTWEEITTQTTGGADWGTTADGQEESTISYVETSTGHITDPTLTTLEDIPMDTNTSISSSFSSGPSTSDLITSTLTSRPSVTTESSQPAGQLLVSKPTPRTRRMIYTNVEIEDPEILAEWRTATRADVTVYESCVITITMLNGAKINLEYQSKVYRQEVSGISSVTAYCN